VNPAPDGRGPGDGADPAPLRTQARSLTTHWLVDTAIAFLATIIVALIFGVPWWAVLIGAATLGALAAPRTHRLDERACAARRAT
jgi:hypothetical protein